MKQNLLVILILMIMFVLPNALPHLNLFEGNSNFSFHKAKVVTTIQNYASDVEKAITNRVSDFGNDVETQIQKIGLDIERQIKVISFIEWFTILPDISMIDISDWIVAKILSIQIPVIEIPQLSLPDLSPFVISVQRWILGFGEFFHDHVYAQILTESKERRIAEPTHVILASNETVDPYIAQTLSDIEPAASSYFLFEEAYRDNKDVSDDEKSSSVNPESGDEIASKFNEFPLESAVLDTETVLVPKNSVIVSSSLNERIEKIPFHSGDTFQKGDVLIEYACDTFKAEQRMANADRTLADKQAMSSYKLFNLKLISQTELQTNINQQKKAEAQQDIIQSKLEACYIRAKFDGRVTNRIANPGEYTRTDRVLLEIASTETLNAEMLIPSRWLRWIDVGAPVQIQVEETMKSYSATIIRVHGEVDPVTQSIQVTASLESYKDRLLPGMSGKASFNVEAIRSAGIEGYLEKPSLEVE